jgi:hypothetical protein
MPKKPFKQSKVQRQRLKKKILPFDNNSPFRHEGKAAADELPLTGYRKHRKSLIIILVFGMIGFLTVPNLLLLPSPGIDNSWQVGLNMAKIRGFQFGKDIMFQFGPLGFMYSPVFCQFNIWLISAAFSLFVHLLLIYSIVIMMKKLSASLIDYVLMGITLMLALVIISAETSVEYKLLFSISILLYLSIINQSNPNRLLMLCVFVSFLMAVVSLIKFTAIFISVGILLFMTVLCLYKKRIRPLCCMLLVYTVSVLVLLVLARQKITNFPAYLLNGYEISKGYNYAGIINGRLREVCVGFYAGGLLIFLLLDSILKNKPGLKYFILINLGFVFVSFKHGFIRHDNAHVYIFFANALLFFCSLYIANKKQLSLLSRCLTLILIFASIPFIFKCCKHMLIPHPLGKLKMIGSVASLITDSAAGKAQKLENAKSELRKVYLLNDETIKYIGNMSTDIMPSEISLVYAYNLNWSPRPLLQSYGAFTDKLDMLNSQHFESVDAPEFLLYAFGSIDGRYPLFDEPATFRTILRNYKPVFIDGKFIILRRADTRNWPPSKTVSVLDTETEFGKPISVPKIKNGYLFAKIYMEYNLLGKIAKLIYKPPIIGIGLLADGSVFGHRFIFSTARNGIFLSQYIHGVRDLAAVWNGKPNNNLDAIVIFTQNQHFYDKHIRVEFFEVPQ